MDVMLIHLLLIAAIIVAGVVIWQRAFVARVLCGLACFPSDSFNHMQSPADRVLICARGLAVIVSPLAFTLALLYSRELIFGEAPYLFLLPVVVVAVDWVFMALSYSAPERTWGLRVLRAALIAVSLSIATIAALLTETANLTQALHRQEDARTMEGNAWRDLEAQRNRVTKQIEHNSAALARRVDLKTRAVEARRLERLECEGAAGTDLRTGTKIIGGYCGPRAATHRANAEAAEAELAHLSRLETENMALRSEEKALRAQLEALLVAGRSEAQSLGTLVRAVAQGAIDLGLAISVGMSVLAIVLSEAFAFLISGIPVPKVLVAAVDQRREEDRMRLEMLHAQKLAAIAEDRREARDKAGEKLPAVIIASGKPHLAVIKGEQDGSPPQGEQNEASDVRQDSING